MEKRKKEKKIIIDVDEELDTTYIGLPTTKGSVGVEIDEDIIVHLNVRKREIIGFTILHWNRFKKKMELKKRAKDSVKAINEYIMKNYPTIHLPTSILLSKTFSHS